MLFRKVIAFSFGEFCFLIYQYQEWCFQFSANLSPQLPCRGVIFITTTQPYSTKSEVRLCAGSNAAHDALGVCDEVCDD